MTARFLLIVIVILQSATTVVRAQRSYATERLQKIGEALQPSVLAAVPRNDTTAVIMTPAGKLAVTVERGKITHLGLPLFETGNMTRATVEKLNFAGRLALEHRLFKAETESLIKTVGIEFENISADRLGHGKPAGDFNVSDIDNRLCRISWKLDNGKTAAFIFPNHHDLISGRTMTENEHMLKQELTSRRDTVLPPAPVNRQRLETQWPPDLQIERGDTLHSRFLSTDRFYETRRRDGVNRLICSSRFPVESAANLFTTAEIDNDIILNVKMKGYGYADSFFKVPLNAFVSYFIENGCRMFFGLQSIDNGNIAFTLIAMNNPEGYCHTMTVTVPAQTAASRRGHADVRMNNFIPTSKIERLYEDKTTQK